MEFIYYVKEDSRWAGGTHPLLGALWTREELNKHLAGSAFAKPLGQEYHHGANARDIRIFVNGMDHGLQMAWRYLHTYVQGDPTAFPMPRVEYSADLQARRAAFPDLFPVEV